MNLPQQSQDSIDFVSTLKKARDRVLYLLEHHPRARDDDKYLYLIYLRTFCDGRKMHSKNFDEFAAYIMTKAVPMPETIRRSRAKLQEQGHFRGEKYEARHKAAEAVSDWAVADKKGAEP